MTNYNNHGFGGKDDRKTRAYAVFYREATGSYLRQPAYVNEDHPHYNIGVQLFACKLGQGWGYHAYMEVYE